MGLLCCFDGGNNAQRKEEDRIASAEALAKAAEAAQRRQEEFEKSAAGRAARAQQQAAAKQAASANKGEPVLKFICLTICSCCGCSGRWVEAELSSLQQLPICLYRYNHVWTANSSSAQNKYSRSPKQT
ncbi:unnamed protein product [Prunus armeniaca]|uniref:Small VCP/p97-interacting protein n=1 Tax=Prunus armeniaca TaxID=36596 RepID=A0A6J5TUW4_PRUAR|nr:unnamed protein product [Prunus armeniaca]